MQTFLRDGFLHLAGAVAEPTARECERRLWTETGYAPDDPTTWTDVTRWVLYRDDEPFIEAVNSPVSRCKCTFRDTELLIRQLKRYKA
ncbi:hypothetical protein ACU61A_39240 [Pseudonocardia sichuanensis]